MALDRETQQVSIGIDCDPSSALRSVFGRPAALLPGSVSVFAMLTFAHDANNKQSSTADRRQRRGRMSGLLLGLVALGISRPVAAAPRLVVSVYPDQGAMAAAPQGASTRPTTCGCDGRFDAADARLGQAMPLGALTVRLLDAQGRELARMATAAQPNGRQSAVFDLPDAIGWRAELRDLPRGWLPCAAAEAPERATGRQDQDLEIGLRPACAPLPAGDARVYQPGINARAADQPRPAGAFHRLVTGQVFVDRDLDGLSDADEVGLAGVRVTLAEGRRTHRTRTAPSGRFTFRGDIATGFVVQVQPPLGYRVTTTDRFQHVPQSAMPGTKIGFGLVAVEGKSAGAAALVAAASVRPTAAQVLASPPRQPDGVHFVAAWPSPAGAATSSTSLGMTGPGPRVGQGRHPTSSIGKDDPTCAS